MWKKFKTWQILLALAVLVGIVLVIIYWTEISTKLGIARMMNGAGSRTSILKNPAVQRIINNTNRELTNSSLDIKSKYRILNARLAQYGLEIQPEGTPPSTFKQIKCGCCSSDFFGLLGTNCCFSKSACTIADCHCPGSTT